ncbi:MAG: DUF2007 domain-containing protein [Armatimonadota bacterium]|nr:DUF2007 domain-containing protein [bacterium]MCS7308626.1 DUF2007 domain-containing protein [Armatimonadota bacterium]MDW8103950.1 DUF2007 domain-containing protein [Armatimonadota bacterium]MDW8289940.1 DUF2007 domain-containing protein [Armatimonadota bacterium]
MRREHRERWILLYTAADVMEGNLVLNLLRNAGIRAVPRPQGHVYAYWNSPMDILVPYEQLVEAQQVLSTAKEAGELAGGDNGHNEQ